MTGASGAEVARAAGELADLAQDRLAKMGGTAESAGPVTSSAGLGQHVVPPEAATPGT